MEELIKAFEDANKKIVEVLAEIKEINEELKKILSFGEEHNIWE